MSGLPCCATEDPDNERDATHYKIERQLKQDKKTHRRKLTIILLGPGDAGKTTFLKQIKYLHWQDPRVLEQDKFIVVLRTNCLQSMQTLLLFERVNVPEELKQHKEAVIAAGELSECVKDILILWENKVIKDAYRRSNELGIPIPSTSNYYWDHADRFSKADYLPTVDDIMRAKLKTTGINHIEVEHKGTTVVLVDVGGQRSERRKWFHMFDSVNTAIFLVALDEYDMVCEEDGQTNRLTESLTLWSEMTDLAIFRPPSWILFLNKWDTFEQKIKTKPLINSNYFKNYIPTTEKEKKILQGDDPLDSFQVMKKQYKKFYKGKPRTLYCHLTCALDTNSVDQIFKSVRDQLITEDLSEFGFGL